MDEKTLNCVLLADRHYGLTEGVCGWLETAFETVVMVTNERSLLEIAGRLQPTLAVVDLSLAPADNLQWIKRLRSLCPYLKLIVLSVYTEPSVFRSAMEAGADGFVAKRNIAMELMPAVDAVLAGIQYTPPGSPDPPFPDV